MASLPDVDETPNKVQSFTADPDRLTDDADFGFVCPRCETVNPLKGHPMNFANKPFKCLECGYVPLLCAEKLEDFCDRHDSFEPEE